MAHKFKLRQQVRMVRTGFSDSQVNAGETFEVIRLLPEDQTGELSYRIRAGMAERAVRESEIILAG
ncbi:hypothetical protein OPKNFCMD_0145 [Methylobacterium crusticola]|uniref:Cold-shock protein n=1 Tax=Methylobacterium crusticola TaxID=1697972 RepID=A0ABQ4QS53_9HYPH|nr:hypothetical protein [Methylobacterium crusticola]GJD47437.1 hypothetical protein OPKNFCMD_0145 [Methylobacterium crusticola]